MKRPPTLVRNAVAVLTKRGHVADVDLDGRHYKVSWVAEGRKRLLVIAKTPSDHRVGKNCAAQLRRLLRVSEEAAEIEETSS
jgi:hypothetical protein